MDAIKCDSAFSVNYQITTNLKPSYYVMNNPVTIDIDRLQKAIDAPRYQIAEEDYESVDSIRDALLALAP
tara:strand:+ start:2441 stop:2650 length:210 start_codon:yes stop_codon:yes gene_type:complete